MHKPVAITWFCIFLQLCIKYKPSLSLYVIIEIPGLFRDCKCQRLIYRDSGSTELSCDVTKGSLCDVINNLFQGISIIH